MLKSSLAINVFISCFLAVEAFAAQESHYQFLKRDCEIQASEGPEGAPQSPPLDVDDPATPGCNKWEINLVVDGDFSREEKNLELPLLDINYGIGDNLQLKYEIPSVNQQAEDKITTGWGDSKVGSKYLFYENETDEDTCGSSRNVVDGPGDGCAPFPRRCTPPH